LHVLKAYTIADLGCDNFCTRLGNKGLLLVYVVQYSFIIHAPKLSALKCKYEPKKGVAAGREIVIKKYNWEKAAKNCARAC